MHDLLMACDKSFPESMFRGRPPSDRSADDNFGKWGGVPLVDDVYFEFENDSGEP